MLLELDDLSAPACAVFLGTVQVFHDHLGRWVDANTKHGLVYHFQTNTYQEMSLTSCDCRLQWRASVKFAPSKKIMEPEDKVTPYHMTNGTTKKTRLDANNEAFTSGI